MRESSHACHPGLNHAQPDAPAKGGGVPFAGAPGLCGRYTCTKRALAGGLCYEIAVAWESTRGQCEPRNGGCVSVSETTCHKHQLLEELRRPSRFTASYGQ